MDFLFLSKLIPLFIYPLGLASILLIVAFILGLKLSRWTPLPILLALVVILTASNPVLSDRLVQSLEWQYFPPSEIPTADAIVVLGGTTKNASPPRIIADMNEHGDRLLYAAKLYKDGKAPLIVLSGGRIQWFGGVESEASDMAKILQLMGIPEEVIIKEPSSLNTYQNAVYTKKILEEKDIKQILLVTSAFHMPRSVSIFRHQGIDIIPAPTDFFVSEQELQQYNYSLESKVISFFPDTGSLDRTTKALKEYIGKFVYGVRGWL